MAASVPWETALELCEEVRAENRRKKLRFLSFQALPCWGCEGFSKGDPAKMCIANGCSLVGARYLKR
ncbi:MAG: hypothetical protein A4E28_02956 [Methanocella sp. PtaU1.Bin125]|nr:MAG: hypothetical protein A4E28_02956 [Methanocella sp. PtaU1.Bin125]